VNTHFTDVVLQEWNKNEIEFNTTVSLKKGTDKDLERLLNCINITTNQTGRNTAYKLILNCSEKKINGFEIDLLIKIPKDIFVEITSSFGDVEMENVHHDFKGDISYGDIKIENLLGENNVVKVRFGNIKLEEAKALSLNIQYGDGKLKEVNTLELDSRFSTIKIDKANSITLSSGYDDISIKNTIDKIEGKMEFGKLKINTLRNSCIFQKFSYSNITINEVLHSFTNITMLASFSDLILNVPRDQSFAFDYYGDFTTFKDKNIKLNDATFEAGSNSLKMSGIYGKNPDLGKKIKIEAKFGTVSLF
jgi:hypothetical protein